MSGTHGADAAGAAAAVSAAGLCRRFGRRWALANLNLRIDAGRAVMLAGHNGSGKSTLLRVIATAIRPDRGQLIVAGRDVRTQRDEVRHRVALLGHHSNTYDALTAFQNLTVMSRMAHIHADRSALGSLLDRVGLGGHGDDDISSFSAGMRKRVAFARVLLQTEPVAPGDRSPKASLVLLDEPYAQLDPQGFRFVDDLIVDFKRRGTTVLMATHLLGRGAELCDDGIVLEEGQVRWAGPAARLPQQSGLSGVTEGSL